VSDSDLLEIAKRNGEFRKWGRWLGALLYMFSLNAARPRSPWWKALMALAIAGVGLWWRYGLPSWL
jgi:hypothetical protein